MPTRAIAYVIVGVVAVGVAVYHNREQVFELVDRGRRKIKEFAEGIVNTHHRAREPTHEARRRHSNARQDYFDAAATARKNEETEGLISSSSAVVASGLLRRPSVEGFRQRSVMDEKQISSARSSVLFDTAPDERRFPLETLSRSRRSSSATVVGEQFNEKEMPPPPLPPRQQQQNSESYNNEQVSAAPPEPESAPEATLVTGRASSPRLIPALATIDVTQVPPQAITKTSASTPSNSQILPPFQSNPHWSIHEWRDGITSPSPPASPSIAGSVPEVVDDNLDVISEFGSDGSSEAGWTEVGSSVSGDD